MLLCLACQAQAEPLISTSYDFYPIAPANRHDIRNELQNKSPAMNAGRDFIGYTDWRVHLSFGRIGVFSTLIENSWQSKQLDNI